MEEIKSTIVTSYRLKEDTKEKIKQQLSSLGLTQEEYFNKVVGLMELENTKRNSLFAVNASEVQELTQRLYNIFINLCEQGNSFLSNKDIEIQELKAKYKDILSDKENVIQRQKEELQQVYTTNNVLLNENEEHKIELMKIKSDYEKQIDQLDNNLRDKSNLIEEYKGKNDMLLSQLKTFEKYPEQLEATKGLLADAQARIMDKDNSIKDKDFTISQLNKSVEDTKSEYIKAIENLKKEHQQQLLNEKDKSELAKDKALLAKDKEHQQELEKIQSRNNAEIEAYQSKYKALLEELEQIKKTGSRKQSEAK